MFNELFLEVLKHEGVVSVTSWANGDDRKIQISRIKSSLHWAVIRFRGRWVWVQGLLLRAQQGF